MPRVVLGVCGGIAAYKAVEVCRRLVDAGVHVAPVLTDDAQRFVGALTFSALASEPARTSLFGGPEPIPHTRLGQTADLDRGRARHRQAARQVRGRHLRRSADRHAARHPRAGARVPGDAHRDVGARRRCRRTSRRCAAAACTCSSPRTAASPAATSAPGRLADPERIADARARRSLAGDHPLTGRTVAGDRGRHPRADRSRCATSGTARRGRWATRSPTSRPGAGAHVVLVTTVDAAGRRRASRSCAVETAEEMHDAVHRPRPTSADAVIMAAAVADFRPKAPSTAEDEEGRRRARDRARADRRHPRRARRAPSAPGQVVVGFAAETERRARERGGQARGQAGRPHGRQRRERRRRRVRGRHEPGAAARRRRERRGDCRCSPRSARRTRARPGRRACWVGPRMARPSNMRRSSRRASCADAVAEE